LKISRFSTPMANRFHRIACGPAIDGAAFARLTLAGGPSQSAMRGGFAGQPVDARRFLTGVPKIGAASS